MKNHGTWSYYTPAEYPPGWPENAIYWKREADGEDWYQWTRENWNVENGVDSSGTMKIIVVNNVATMKSLDVTGLAGPSPFDLYELEPGDTVPQLLWVLVDGQFQAP
ncbi:hypothetical protein [Rhizobium sp. X9]|uniref:hypothetical protein n=1 Tax=Rhizobium sp. X9 TaxID=2815360 RepID=UPI001C0B9A33|nr:hypothetical protein [Rhizobium sp. X9]